MKRLLLSIADLLSVIWHLVPTSARRLMLKGMFVIESRGGDRGAALKRLFELQDELEHVVNERALVYGVGVHPKHRLMRYHDFFVDRIVDGEAVIDIGCGYGAVARSIARARSNSRVLGVDYDEGRLGQAKGHPDTPANLSFVLADALKSVPDGPWNVVVLSNVLEHIRERPEFLLRLQATTGAQRFLIRVPLFERDWKLPMRREVGANYYSDPDHKIEHTRAEFMEEMSRANLKPEETILLWGEIWCALRVHSIEGATR